jgi:predicted nucleic acid-binding protein
MEKTMAISRIYWDSCAFIDWLEGDPDYILSLQEMVHQADDLERLKIVTSAATFAEVYKVKTSNGAAPLPEKTRQAILGLLRREKLVSIYQVDRFVGELANKIVANEKLKPMDALHLATALQARVDAVITTDRPMIRRTGILHFNDKVIDSGSPPLKIMLPQDWLRDLLPLLAPAQTLTQAKTHEEESEGEQEARPEAPRPQG